MEIKKVYICYNKEEYNTKSIEKILRDENYKYKFHFGNDLPTVNDCDEFWYFGNCSGIEAYRKAIDLGIDMWEMG